MLYPIIFPTDDALIENTNQNIAPPRRPVRQIVNPYEYKLKYVRFECFIYIADVTLILLKYYIHYT